MVNATQKTRPAVGEIEVLIDSGPLPSKYKTPAMVAGVGFLAVSANSLVYFFWGFGMFPSLMRDLRDLQVVIFLVTAVMGALFINVCFTRRWVLLNPKTKQVVIENQWVGGVRSSPIFITQILRIVVRHVQRGSREFWDIVVEDTNDSSKWLTRVTTTQEDAKELAGKIAQKINRKVALR